MNIEALSTDLILRKDRSASRWAGAMEGGARVDATLARRRPPPPPQVQGGLNRTKSFQSGYFGVETLLVLACLAASLLILPLVLPPLSPPPLMFLLIPIGIMAVLMLLALMPSDVRNIASSYL